MTGYISWAMPIVGKLTHEAAVLDALNLAEAPGICRDAAAIITDLYEALEIALQVYGNEGCACSACMKARAALAKARQP